MSGVSAAPSIQLMHTALESILTSKSQLLINPVRTYDKTRTLDNRAFSDHDIDPLRLSLLTQEFGRFIVVNSMLEATELNDATVISSCTDRFPSWDNNASATFMYDNDTNVAMHPSTRYLRLPAQT